MFTIDYIILVSINAILVIYVIYKVVTQGSLTSYKDDNSENENDNDNDGNVFDLTPPTLDLPPGIDWPSDNEDEIVDERSFRAKELN